MAEEKPQVPAFSLDGLDLDSLRESLGTIEVPPVTETETPPVFVQPPKRKRGRPKGTGKNQIKARLAGVPKTPIDSPEPEIIEDADGPSISIKPAPLTKRDEKEVAARLINILTGATGVASNIKPYLQMTDEEAKAISDPLSSYLVRNADTIPIAGQILENYDLLAITLGVLAYVVRIYHDRSEEIVEQRKLNPKRSLSERVAEHTNPSNNGQTEGSTNWVSSAYGEGNGLNP